MLKRTSTYLAPVVFAVVTVASAGAMTIGSASADPLVACLTTPCIDFGNVLEGGGTASYAGGDAPLVGTDIQISRIDGIGTPENSTFPLDGLIVSNGLLDFETGALIEYDPITGYHFAGGGSFVITGGIAELGLDDDTVLATGTFTEAMFQPGPLQFSVALRGTDTKHEDIVTYFGLDPNLLFAFQGGFLTEPFLAGPEPDPFSVDVLSIDIPNVPADAVIPEPATLLLMGSGIAVHGALMRRRRRSRN